MEKEVFKELNEQDLVRNACWELEVRHSALSVSACAWASVSLSFKRWCWKDVVSQMVMIF